MLFCMRQSRANPKAAGTNEFQWSSIDSILHAIMNAKLSGVNVDYAMFLFNNIQQYKFIHL